MILILILEDLFFNGFIFFAEIFPNAFQTYSFLQNKGTNETTAVTVAVEKEEDVVCSKRETDLPLWGLPREPFQYGKKTQVEKYSESVLSMNELNFYENLIADVTSENVTNTYVDEAEIAYFESYISEMDVGEDEDLPMPTSYDFIDSNEEIYAEPLESIEFAPESLPEENPMLSMNDWNEEALPEIDISTAFSHAADSTIGSYLLGEQIWVAEVVGEEQGCIHVSDGTGRAWIDTGVATHFGKGDILSLFVDRKTNLIVDLLKAETLQVFSTDFSMLDDLDNESYGSEYSEIA